MDLNEVVALLVVVVAIGAIVWVILELHRAKQDLKIQKLRTNHASMNGWVADRVGELRKMSDEELRAELERMVTEDSQQ